jgi:hypothetical protein
LTMRAKHIGRASCCATNRAINHQSDGPLFDRTAVNSLHNSAPTPIDAQLTARW